jgi:hypothetical protein
VPAGVPGLVGVPEVGGVAGLPGVAGKGEPVICGVVPWMREMPHMNGQSYLIILI